MAPGIINSPPRGGDVEMGAASILASKKPVSGKVSSANDIAKILAPLYKSSNLAKILSTAEKYLAQNDPPKRFPETVPQTGPQKGIYQCRDADFWTCGFFPGSIYCVLERLRKYPGSSMSKACQPEDVPRDFPFSLIEHVTDLCQKWSAPLHAMSKRTDTHDLGFIVQPALRRDWELFGNKQCLISLFTAAESLASRYDERVGAIRSWDSFKNAHHSITSMDDDFLVIIDSLCNLDLLFYAGSCKRSPRLFEIASKHAETLLSTHLRTESVEPGKTLFSTYHATNLSPKDNGKVKRRLTAQGYDDSSTWARGQAWAILGYAQTFAWTRDPRFLEASLGLADYFIYRLESSPDVVVENGVGRYVPLWDFDAPIKYTNVHGSEAPLRDVSAGMIAANGMTILYGLLQGAGKNELAKRYLDYSLVIAKDTVALAYNNDEMGMSFDSETGKIKTYAIGTVDGRSFDGILERSTSNFNQDHADRTWDHGLVYADYYFLELGNRFLDMGLV
ncbi:hypothetical protein N7451_005644 [Penicillium sp. IBT 35674x]|nr:hypothetical protein N7451_005644 [Penicillium sp. IBT 35674x]